MGDRVPVSTLEDLASLDDDEILEGYRDGMFDDVTCGGNRSRSYWHGWSNAQRDRGRQPGTAEAANLAREYVEMMRAVRH